MFGAVAERRDDLAALTENANEALGAIAAENDGVRRALSALPPAMRQANTTFVNLRAALDDLDPLIADLGDVAPDLPQFLRDVRPVARNAIRPLAQPATAIRRNGAKNDLTDALRDLPAAQRTAQQRGAGHRRRARRLAAHLRVRPALLAGPGRADLEARPGRRLLRLQRPLPPRTGGRLEPLRLRRGHRGSRLRSRSARSSTPIRRSGLGPFIRCPGGATQANAGWPAPEDHPFLADGELSPPD